MTTEIIQMHINIIYKRAISSFHAPNIKFYKEVLEEVDKKLHFLSEFSALPRAHSY